MQFLRNGERCVLVSPECYRCRLKVICSYGKTPLDLLWNQDQSHKLGNHCYFWASFKSRNPIMLLPMTLSVILKQPNACLRDPQSASTAPQIFTNELPSTASSLQIYYWQQQTGVHCVRPHMNLQHPTCQQSFQMLTNSFYILSWERTSQRNGAKSGMQLNIISWRSLISVCNVWWTLVIPAMTGQSSFFKKKETNILLFVHVPLAKK